MVYFYAGPESCQTWTTSPYCDWEEPEQTTVKYCSCAMGPGMLHETENSLDSVVVRVYPQLSPKLPTVLPSISTGTLTPKYVDEIWLLGVAGTLWIEPN